MYSVIVSDEAAFSKLLLKSLSLFFMSKKNLSTDHAVIMR